MQRDGMESRLTKTYMVELTEIEMWIIASILKRQEEASEKAIAESNLDQATKDNLSSMIYDYSTIRVKFDEVKL